MIAAVVAAAALAVWHAPCARASPAADFQVRFSPNRLGHSTNISFAIQIGARARALPPPLTGLDIRFPRQLGFALSGLGLATCSAATVEVSGPGACPRNSWMGRGKAFAEVPFGPEILGETASVSILRTADIGGSIAMLFAVEASTPVLSDLVLPGELQTGQGPFETIHIDVPLVATLPEAPDVSVIRLFASIGPRSLVYYERVHGHRVPYHPEGIVLPRQCPTGGFRFQAALTFLGQGTTTSKAVVPCHRGSG